MSEYYPEFEQPWFVGVRNTEFLKSPSHDAIDLKWAGNSVRWYLQRPEPLRGMPHYMDVKFTKNAEGLEIMGSFGLTVLPSASNVIEVRFRPS